MEEMVFTAIIILTAVLFWIVSGSLVGAFISMLAVGPLLGSFGYLVTYRVRTGDWGVESG